MDRDDQQCLLEMLSLKCKERDNRSTLYTDALPPTSRTEKEARCLEQASPLRQVGVGRGNLECSMRSCPHTQQLSAGHLLSPGITLALNIQGGQPKLLVHTLKPE